jgi:hypothetical protein
MTSNMRNKALVFCFIALFFGCRTSVNNKTIPTEKKNDALANYIQSDDSLTVNCFNQADIAAIKALLHEQKVSIRQFRIQADNSKNCVGLYRIYSKDWKQLKKEINYNGITIPVLKFNDKIALNAYYLKSNARLPDTLNVKSDITEFKKKYNALFSETELKEIEGFYTYGIDVTLKGYWR